MGEEIERSRFTPEDMGRFRRALIEETQLVQQWLEQGRFDEGGAVAGFELEAWLVDEYLRPMPINAAFLQRLDSFLASPELASFNIEVNGTPRPLSGNVFSAMHAELQATWRHCEQTALDLGSQAVMIGILPTVENEHLNLSNMSQMERYRALNREVVRMRQGKPIVLDINGVEHLHVTHRDVMLESAATSFQLHLQVAPQHAVRAYNLCCILSAPMVALAANSPFLFGKDLWDETRIPLFEQAVPVGGYDGAAFGPIRRVTFGSGYARQSLLECFQENLQHYPIMLPVELLGDPAALHHLRLHNGTIWRWNRPLIGFDETGRPHLRIEHRVIPSGPTITDAMANAAFFYGVVTAMCAQPTKYEDEIPFDKARDNFYKAARSGLRAQVSWCGKDHIGLQGLILQTLLPMAHAGLEQLGVSGSDRQDYLAIIEARVGSGSNGANWQRAWVAKHGAKMEALTAAYLERQQQGQPVHEWRV